MNELQSVTDIDEVIKYAEREAEGCNQMASAYHTDEGVYLHEETRFQYKAILWENIHEWLEELKELRKKQRPQWISCAERLPEDLEPVNITWVNHEPEPYYHDIKDKNFVATGIHYRGQWYWYSTTCADYLGEYGSNDIDLVDDAIEIIAWMPLPKQYKEEGDEK